MKILIPAYQPDQKMLSLIWSLKAMTTDDIVVVDDGSGPEYQKWFASAEEVGCTVLRHGVNRGKGVALKTGLQWIIGQGEMEGVVCADCDGQHSPSDILKVAAATRAGNIQIILGSRQFVGKVPWKSRLGNTITRLVFAGATRERIRDTQTGLRGYPARMLNWLISVPGSRYEYEVNVLLEAHHARFPIYEVPISTIYDNDNQGSHFHPFLDSARIYLPILKFSASSLLAAFTDFALLLILESVSGNLLVSVLGARVGSSLCNYLCNRQFVFHRGRFGHTLVRYYTLAAAILGGNYLLIDLLINTAGIHLIPAKIITEALLFGLSYWMQQKYVFRPRGLAPTG